MHVIAISLGRNILNVESRDRLRAVAYARGVNAYHVIILTRKIHGYTHDVHEGTLHVYPTNSRTRFLMLWDAYRIGRKIIREQSAESIVITAQDPLEVGWLSWFLSRSKNTHLHVQVHGDYFSSDAWVGHSFVRRVKRFFAQVLLHRTPAIRVVSERIKRSLVTRGIPESKITVLPIRPELELFLSCEHTYRTQPPFTFLYLGRLAPEKNIPLIVNAFALAHKKHPNIRLRIVGEGSEQARIESLITSLGITGAVAVLPWTRDVAREMNAADVFLLASQHEAYALTLVEAMAVGLPIITTDVGCVGDVVRDGIHGIVVRDESVESYAHALEQMLAQVSKWKAYGEQGQATARKLAEQSHEKYVHAWVTALSHACREV